MADIYIPQRDKGFYLSFTITDANGDAFDLTDYTPSIKVWPLGKPGNLLINATCEVTATTGGLCRYLVATNDFISDGTFQIEIECTKTGVIESTEAYTVEVKESP